MLGLDKNSAGFIWVKPEHYGLEQQLKPCLVLFHKDFNLSAEDLEGVKSALLRLSADTRYKLYVNGQLAAFGPSKGDHFVWFYDELDLRPFLKQGRNVLTFQVLHYPAIAKQGNHSLYRTFYPHLYVQGGLEFQTKGDSSCRLIDLTANESYAYCVVPNFKLMAENSCFVPLYIYEDFAASQEVVDFMQGKVSSGNLSSCNYAQAYQQCDTALSPFNLQPREIKYLTHTEKPFDLVMQVKLGAEIVAKEQVAQWLESPETHTLTIPAHSHVVFDLGLEHLRCGFMSLQLQGGAGAVLKLTQSEAYTTGKMLTPLAWEKKVRDDYEHGELLGHFDRYVVSGVAGECYQPFWLRTLRFMRVDITTQDQPLVLGKWSLSEVLYPLDITTQLKFSSDELSQSSLESTQSMSKTGGVDGVEGIEEVECVEGVEGIALERLQEIYAMHLRTLRLCMHETYEDCPFYEQLQYVMDSRAQILFTYRLASDDSLARQALYAFAASQRSDGMINCSAPNFEANVIPGFALYYVLMLADHYLYFGDKAIVERYFPVVMRILQFFARQIDPKTGLVGRVGGLNGVGRYWSFIDWTPQWNETTGVPPAVLEGSLTMENLLYVMALHEAHKLAQALGFNDLSKRYFSDADKIKAAILEHCVNKNGFITDGPVCIERPDSHSNDVSSHCQVFAILAGLVDAQQHKDKLLTCLNDKERYAQCSVAMSFYLYRALEQCGLYSMVAQELKLYERMLAKHATTCVENEVDERSDCHAWGAVLLYELPATILGLQPIKTGFTKVLISPHLELIAQHSYHIQGEVSTPQGVIKVKIERRASGNTHYELFLPTHMSWQLGDLANCNVLVTEHADATHVELDF